MGDPAEEYTPERRCLLRLDHQQHPSVAAHTDQLRDQQHHVCRYPLASRAYNAANEATSANETRTVRALFISRWAVSHLCRVRLPDDAAEATIHRSVERGI